MPAFTNMRRTVGRLSSIPSRSCNNSVKWLWLAPAYPLLASFTTAAATVLGTALWGLRPRLPWASAAGPSLR